MKTRSKWTLAGAGVIVAAVAILIVVATRGTVTYYYTVGELLEKGPTQAVRLAGQVVPGSIEKAGLGDTLRFRIEDKGLAENSLLIVYEGSRPDTLTDDAGLEVVVEGDYAGGDTFAATYLLTKCPSKYEKAAEEKVQELEQ